MITFGRKLKHLRQKNHLTQKELGIALGFPEDSADVRIAQYEADARKPRDEILAKMAKILYVEKSFTARLSTHNRMSDWGGKPAFGLLPLSAHKQNKEIPSMAVLALFIETIDGIAYFAIAVRGFFQF